MWMGPASRKMRWRMIFFCCLWVWDTWLPQVHARAAAGCRPAHILPQSYSPGVAGSWQPAGRAKSGFVRLLCTYSGSHGQTVHFLKMPLLAVIGLNTCFEGLHHCGLDAITGFSKPVELPPEGGAGRRGGQGGCRSARKANPEPEQEQVQLQVFLWSAGCHLWLEKGRQQEHGAAC